ncbi:unnamed protein product [Schistosoma mattheei]|uniref:Uncharacterized protein n=1 Tax=Schistosoma mattheei TaxID=31246 RepID=A0A183P4V8_9TREM|nr:unnamed protein product [Schistosoma mattheei]
MQEKMSSVTAASALVDLNIHKVKSKILRYSTTCTIRITLDGEDLEDVKSLTYLGSIIDERSGSDAHMKARMGKVRTAYLQLKNIRNSKQLSTNTKVRIFNTNVKTALLYMVNLGELRKLSSSRFKCLLGVIYAKYLGPVGQTLLTTTYCGSTQSRSKRREKSGRSAGSG